MTTEALEKIKRCFISELLLQHFNLSKPIYIFTDISSYAAIAILMQQYGNSLHPVVFWSRKFTSPEQNYTIIEQELLPIVKAMNYW